MTARCFRRSKVPIYGLDYEGRNLGFFSRLIYSEIMPPTDDELVWLDFLLTWLQRLNNYVVLIPTTDEFVFLTAKYQNELSKYAYSLIPSYLTLNTIIQRDRQFTFASQCGLNIPRYIRGPIESIEEVNLKFPIVVKPSNAPEWRKAFNHKGVIIHKAEHLEQALDLINKQAVGYLIQEIIRGDNRNNYEVNSLFLPNGEYYRHVIRKIRQLPDEYGTATCIEAFQNEELAVFTESYIRKMNLLGFTNIEFKYSQETKRYYYIETNPRVWLQVNFSSSLGLNLPMLYYYFLTGSHPVTAHVIQNKGKWVDPAPDFLYFLRNRKQKKLSFTKWLKDWLPIKSFGLFSFQDPYPFLKEYKFGLRFLQWKIKK